MSTRSSSPDPLSAPTGPSISEPSRHARSVSKRSSATPTHRTATPSKNRSTSTVMIHSPARMTATSSSVLSPWRIKVMVEAERDDGGDGEAETPSGRGKIQRNFIVGLDGSVEDDDELSLPREQKKPPLRGFATRTTTTKVPVKGLSSSPGKPEDALELAGKGKGKGRATAVRRTATPAAKAPATPKARSSVGRTPRKTAAAAAANPATPRRKRAAPAQTPTKGKRKATEDGEDMEVEMIDAPPIETSVPATLGMPSSTTKISTKVTRTTRTTTRRTIAPPPAPTLASTRSRRSSAAPSSVAATPAISKRSTRETSVVSNGGIMPRSAYSGKDLNPLLSPSLGKINSPILSRSSSRNSVGPSESIQDDDGDTIVVSQPGTARKDGSTFIISEGGSLSLPEFVHPASLSSDLEMSDADEYSPSIRELDVDMSEEEALADVPMDSEFDPQSNPLFENSVGVNSFYGVKEDEDEDMPTSSILPEGSSDPAAADFTYYSNGVSYTPRGGNRATFDERDSAIIEDNPIGSGTFYELPSSSKPRDKGKGKVAEGLKGEITPEESPLQQAGQEISFYPSSPPFRVVIPGPSGSKNIATPALGQKRGNETDIPDAPACKRTNRDTPSLVRVRRASDVMSDALDVDMPMVMVQQNFGNGFEAPPTPESQDEKAHISVSYPSIPETSSSVGDASMNNTGIPSPTPSGGDLSAASKSPESGAGFLSRIFTPLKRVVLAAQVPNSAAHLEAMTPSRPPHSAPTPGPHSVATIQPDGEISAEDQQSLLERSELVEDDSAQAIANETIIQEARAASMERTKALLEEWDRERSEVRQQANAVGAITIDGSDTEDDEIYEDEGLYLQSRSQSLPLQSQSSQSSRSQSFRSQPSQSSQSQTSQSQWSQSQSFRSQSQSQSFGSQSQSFQSQSSFQSQTSHARQLDRETAAYEESLTQQTGSEEEEHHTPRPFSAHNDSSTPQPASSSFTSSSKITARTRGFTPRVEDSISISRAATPRAQPHISTASFSGSAADVSSNAQADSMLETISTISGPSSASASGLIWTAENYKHLDAILASKSTDPAKATKCYKVQLERPERLLGRELVASLKLDSEGYLQLDRKESAAVERFLRREQMSGRDWGLVEVVRRVAGMKVAGKRREWLKRGMAGR